MSIKTNYLRPLFCVDTPYKSKFLHPPENLTYQYGICNNFIKFDTLHILIISQPAIVFDYV